KAPHVPRHPPRSSPQRDLPGACRDSRSRERREIPAVDRGAIRHLQRRGPSNRGRGTGPGLAAPGMSRRAIMNEDRLREIAERDQLWASLRALHAEIQRIATGQFQGTEREVQLVMVLARVVDSELRFRAESSPASE